MEDKLPGDQVKSVLAPWRFYLQSSGFEVRLVTALELFEHFPLDIAVTGGTEAANERLASAVCGLKGEYEKEKEWQEEVTDEESEEEEEEEEEEDDEEDEEDVESASVLSERKPRVSFVGFTDDDPDKEGSDSSTMLSHPRIPNVRIWRVQGCSAPPQHTYDVLVVLTTELHQEDHMRITVEQSERNKSLYLVKAEEELDLVREKLKGPCKTCAWERMQARTLEFQRKKKEALELEANANDHKTSSEPALLSNGIKLWEFEEIAEAVEKAIHELRKKVYSQFLVDITSELTVLSSLLNLGPKDQHDGKGPLVSTALKMHKLSQADIDQISKIFQTRDLTDQPSKLTSILTALEHFRLDVGVLGESGCGSSSLFNALLGFDKEDKSAAPTGVIETTKEPLSHPYSKHSNVFLWDFPGLGRVGDLNNQSSLHQASSLTSNLPTCDVYILVTPLRLSLVYIQVLQYLLSQHKACYVVLSKADLIEKTLTEEVKKWSEEVLGKLGLEQNVFLVSARHPETLDLPQIQETLNGALQNHKRDAFSNYLAKLVKDNTFWKKPESCNFL